MDFQIGSLGNLISGKSEKCVGPKIVFEKVNQFSEDKQIVNGLKGLKPKALAKVQDKGRVVKGKIIGSLLKNKKPDLAGDNDSKTIGKSWKQFPNRGDDFEGDGFQPQTSSFSLNAARRIHIKNNTKKHVDDPEREKRTLFVGNIPYAQSKKKKLMKLFSKYGVVESVRFRCAPLKDPRMPKKVAVIKNDFHPERSSICAYVVFKSEAEAKCALEANGSVYHDHHLRVDLASNASNILNDPRKSVFVGNLSFAAEEEELWQLFSGCGTISSVRIIRDPITAVSKGVAYVNFDTTDAAELALHLNGHILRKRSITVNRHRPPAQPSVHKNLSEKLIHKRKDKSSEANTNKKNIKEEIRMKKKEKRKLRRDGEKLILGFVKKKKSQPESNEVSKPEAKQQSAKTVTQVPNSKEHSKSKFQGQTFENSQKKKKKVNKTELKKKKLAKVLGARGQKKKEGS